MLLTERCRLCKPRLADYEQIRLLFQDEMVRAYLGGPRHDQTIQAIFSDMLVAKPPTHHWLIFHVEQDQFMGLVSLNPHHDGAQIEVSYQFLPHWWGAGYASEVVAFICAYARTILGESKILAETQIANTRSCQLLERIGMRPEYQVERFGAKQIVYALEATCDE
ncbi:GNAT family N-acetyltransferase [Ornithinibacillus gellani]|uniref:GNAT family N-acetyltransferase n=1 Tax=Ornithinibacillus gellani TaxID=2293253 RepID=UPI001680B977|nr:GNAT family N-acetyltransferase [Ornithinibacillus gellani]